MARILLVDDDDELIELLREYLGGEGFEISAARDGKSGLRAVLGDPPDLVVLDVMLPGLSGLEALRLIRHHSAVPVIMLTARGEEVDRVVGFELGADDYVPKPFSPRELVARIRAVLRRGGAVSGESLLVVGDLVVDSGARRVTRASKEVELTGTEFSILEVLVRSAGTVVSRDTLFQQVLGRRPRPFDRSLDVHISNLRKKLGPLAGGDERIKTVRGAGHQYVRKGD